MHWHWLFCEQFVNKLFLRPWWGLFGSLLSRLFFKIVESLIAMNGFNDLGGQPGADPERELCWEAEDSRTWHHIRRLASSKIASQLVSTSETHPYKYVSILNIFPNRTWYIQHDFYLDIIPVNVTDPSNKKHKTEDGEVRSQCYGKILLHSSFLDITSLYHICHLKKFLGNFAKLI